MTATSGSHPIAAERAIAALAAKGCTSLEAKLGGHYASFGGLPCFHTDNATREAVRRDCDGRRYHRESIGRARRKLARMALITSARIMPLQKPTGARWRSPHGTTEKIVRWEMLGVPAYKMPRARRRKERKENDRRERQRQREEGIGLPLPPPPSRNRSAHVVPALAALVQGLGSVAAPKAPPVVDHKPPPRVQPPSLPTAPWREMSVEQREAEIERQLRERGPPPGSNDSSK